MSLIPNVMATSVRFFDDINCFEPSLGDYSQKTIKCELFFWPKMTLAWDRTLQDFEVAYHMAGCTQMIFNLS